MMGSERPFNGEITIGPFGGTAGEKFDFKASVAITQIVIAYSSETVESIRFKGDGEGEYSNKLGGRSHRVARTDKIVIDFPTEYLTGVCWTVGYQDNREVVKSLRFFTNLNDYGPFGSETVQKASIRQKGAAIIGFHGRSELLVDSIGFYLKPLCWVFAVVPRIGAPYSTWAETLKGLFLSTSKNHRSPGPWGSNLGRTFDDGVFVKVNKIQLYLCNESKSLSGVQFQYLKKDGKAVWSPLHGTGDREVVQKIDLGEEEYVVGVEGYYGKSDAASGYDVIRSLTFTTSSGKYGPVGKEIGTFFTSISCKANVVGFFGRSGHFLEAIGVHAEYE
ncbi:jacalin-related lectin 3-like [Andrographis paniculata]|uniref:jacalin-related lectin 3-like n=1 Tax=Andrographis paniculata TaxID=175694 RepID=UPI0021E80D85|nr:jacalin-related lectin 3-like [Andrographis paniculata]